MSLVERAMEKLRRSPSAGEAAQQWGEVIHRPVAVSVPSEAQTGEVPALPLRHIAIDQQRLRAAGYLPETGEDRRFAAQFRQIKRPIIHNAFKGREPGKADPRLVMMASALSGDGKTFTSINLAFSMARERDLQVLLVDADFPKPHVSAIFGAGKEPGLMDALADRNVDAESLVLPTDIKGLSILPAGHKREGTTELLASERMVQVLERLLARHPKRVLLFDSAPILLATDAVALAGQAGQVLLVVRSGHTPREAVLDALDQLGENATLSLVLNQGRIGLKNRYHGYGYGTYSEYDAPSA